MATRFSSINKKQAGLVILGLTAFGLMLKFSAHVPYLYPPGLFYGLLCAFFLIIFFTSIYLRFLKKGKTGKTDWQDDIERSITKKTLIAVIFFPTFSLLIAWCFTHLTILPTHHFANGSYQAIAQVTNIKDRGRALDRWAGITLTFPDERYKGTLVWPKHPLVDQIQVGDTVHLTGRKWFLGRIVEHIELVEKGE